MILQDLILRHYHYYESHKQYRLLRRDFWYGQQHGRKGPVHARFMRPRCDIVPTGKRQLQLILSQLTRLKDLQSLDATHRDFVTSVTYSSLASIFTC